MNKPSIRIIKRSVEMIAETLNEPKIFDSSVKAARQTKREIVKTITGWIDEQREHHRLAEIIAGQMISGKLLTSRE